jgi:hypothetical protein
MFCTRVARLIHYKQYSIKSVPNRFLTSGKWELNIRILWKSDGMVTMRTFTAPGLYDTEDEADIHGITYGQRIVDGKVAGVTLD